MTKDVTPSAKVVRESGGQGIMFWCPGCDLAHRVLPLPGLWTFNGDFDKPTISPSLLVQWDEGTPDKPVPYRCHCFVTDGRVEYLDDCTHQLKGRTVALAPFDWGS